MLSYVAFALVSGAVWLVLRKPAATAQAPALPATIPATLRPMAELVAPALAPIDRTAWFADLLRLQEHLRTAGNDERVVRGIIDPIAPLLLRDKSQPAATSIGYDGPVKGVDQ